MSDTPRVDALLKEQETRMAYGLDDDIKEGLRQIERELSARPEAASINPLQMALDSQEFYELSQAYRHAKDDRPRKAGEPDPVVVAWENLKRYIIDNSQVVDRRDIIEECWQALDSLIARGELPEPQRERRNGLIIACNQLFDMGAYGRGKESREPQNGESK